MFNIVKWLRAMRSDIDTLWAAVAEMQEQRECQIGFEIEDTDEDYEYIVVPEFEVTDVPYEDEGGWIESGSSDN